MRYAVVATGGSVEQADQFLLRFSNSVAQAAKGQGDLYNFLRVNNVALKDTQGNLLPTNVLLGKYADLVKNTKSPQDQLNEAIMVGGRQAGPAFLDVLKDGSDGLQKFGVDAQNAGVILSKDLIAQAKIAAAQFSILKLQTETTFEKLAVDIANAVKEANEQAKRDQIANAQIAKEQWQSVSEYVAAHPTLGKIIYYISGGSLLTSEQIPTPGAAPAPKPADPYPGDASNREDLYGEGLALLRAGQGKPYAPPKKDDDGDNLTKQYQAQEEAFQKLLKTQDARVDQLQKERDGIGLTVSQQTEMIEKIKLENELKQQNIPITADRQAAIDAEAKKLGEAAQALDTYKRQWQGMNSAAQFAGDQLIDVMDGIRTGTLSASDAINQLTNSLIHAVEQAALLGSGPLANVLGFQSNVSGGTGGLFGQALNLLRGGASSGGTNLGPDVFVGPPIPGNAGGTDNWPGGLSWVGEKGPEVVNLPRGAQVIPNNVLGRMGAGGDVNVIVNNAPPGTTVKQSAGPGGSRTVEVDLKRRIDSTVAGLLSQGDSATNKAFEQSYGVRRKI
jgi:hypothetical protein